MRTVIIQRTVPHYRVPLFARLHAELGWLVASDAAPPGHGLQPIGDAPPWLHRFDFHRDPGRAYRARVPVDEILATLRPDAVVAEFSPQMSSTWRLSADALLRRARGRKLAFWSQGPNVERGFVSVRDRLAQALRVALMAPADAQIAYSEQGAAWLRRRLPGAPPVFVAPNTIDIAALPDRALDGASADPAALDVLFVGRLTPDKRVPLLVEAFALAQHQAPEMRLTIVGDGPDMARTRAAAAGLGEAIEIVGPVYDPVALAPYFQRAGVFAYAGGIGLAANQALAYGVPVMVFDDPGPGARHHPEHANVIEGRTGFRVRPASVEAMAAALVDLTRAAVPPKTELGDSIRAYAQERLTLDRMIDGFRALDRWLSEHA